MNEIDTAIDEYLKEIWEEYPVAATQFGIDGYEERLGDFSLEAFERRAAKTDDWKKRFTEIPESGLSLDEKIDRELVLSQLEGDLIRRDWESHKRDPSDYLGPALSGIFSLFLHRMLPEPDLAGAAIARMQAIPELADHAKKNLDASIANKLIVQRGLGMCQAAVGYFRNLVPKEVEDPSLQEKLGEPGDRAAAAMEDLAEHLGKLADEAAGDWAFGDDRYSALLKDKEQLGYGAEEMLERGKQAFADLDKEMADLAEKEKGTRDWSAVSVELQKEHPSTPENMRKSYEEWTEKGRQFLKDRILVGFPKGEECLVEPSPHFQRPILAVASYNPPPPFKPSLTGHFFVPYPPEGTSPEEEQKRLESNSDHMIPTTSVHEAYPGHHWHLVTMQGNPRVIRRVIRTAYFTEGWALYTEKMMREEGFYKDWRHEFGYLEARIFRAARIIIDTSLHLGKMTHDEAVEMLTGRGLLSEPTAVAEVGRYCTWPTQAPSYLTGALEIEAMRDRYLSEGLGNLKSFHDAIAFSGGLPIGLAKKALFEGASSK